jgi:hypothetical protein
LQNTRANPENSAPSFLKQVLGILETKPEGWKDRMNVLKEQMKMAIHAPPDIDLTKL